MSCVWQGIVGNSLVYHHRQQTRFLQSIGPWYLFLSVSQSRWTIANKILLSVHLSGLDSFTDREDVFEDWLCTEVLLINKHAYFVNEWTNQRHQYKTALCPSNNNVASTSNWQRSTVSIPTQKTRSCYRSQYMDIGSLSSEAQEKLCLPQH